MLNALKIALIAGCAMAGFASNGFAADLDQPIFVEQAPDYAPVEIGNGWYIRGDVGYAAIHKGGTHTYRTYDPISTTYADQTFVTSGTSADFAFGGGIGYQFSDWLRFDGTIDAYRGKFTGTTASTGNCYPGLAAGDPGFNTSCATNDEQGYNAYQFMANAYVDLGTYVGLTPYVGAGAGYTVMAWDGLTNSLYCVPGAGGGATATCPATPIAPVTHAGTTDYRFTYSVMAGAAYQMSKNVKLDMGYRYSKIAAGTQFNFDQASITAGATGVQGRDAGYDRHEVRVGVRYSLW